MSALEEELEFSDVNSVNSKLSSFPSYEIEEENDSASADRLTNDGEEDGVAFFKEPLADAEWMVEYEREKYPFRIVGIEMHRAYHRALRWLPLDPHLFFKINSFLPLPLSFWAVVHDKMESCAAIYLGFVFLVAVTSRSLRFADKSSLFINPL